MNAKTNNEIEDHECEDQSRLQNPKITSFAQNSHIFARPWNLDTAPVVCVYSVNDANMYVQIDPTKSK